MPLLLIARQIYLARQRLPPTRLKLAAAGTLNAIRDIGDTGHCPERTA